MPIVFAENFANFKMANLLLRYPGSTLPTNVTDGGLSYGGVIATAAPTSSITSREIYVTFGGAPSNTSGGDGWIWGNWLGIQVTYRTGTITVNGTTAATSTPYTNLDWFHVIVRQITGGWEFQAYDSNGMKAKGSIAAPSFTGTFIDGSSDVTAPELITSIVCRDNESDIISSVQFEDAALQVDSVGSWKYSNQGIIPDTSKTDDTVSTPNAYIAVDASDTQLAMSVPKAYDYLSWYASVQTSPMGPYTPVAITVNGAQDAFGLQPTLTQTKVITNSNLLLDVHPTKVLAQFNKQDISPYLNGKPVSSNISQLDRYMPWTVGPIMGNYNALASTGMGLLSAPTTAGQYLTATLPGMLYAVPCTFEFVFQGTSASTIYPAGSPIYDVFNITNNANSTLYLGFPTATTISVNNGAGVTVPTIVNAVRYIVCTIVPYSSGSATVTVWYAGQQVYSANRANYIDYLHFGNIASASYGSAGGYWNNWRLMIGDPVYTTSNPPPATLAAPFPIPAKA